MDLYPAIDIRDGGAVRLTQGDFDRQSDYGDPLELAAKFVAGGARWLHVVDLDAARSGEPVNRETVLAIARASAVPVETGGGVRTLDDVTELLDGGVARVILGTAALEDPDLVRRATAARPGQVALGIDYRTTDGRAEVAVRGWEQSSGRTVGQLLNEVAGAGLSAVVVTAIERDGTLSGPDVDGLRSVLASTEVPVIASGGIGSVTHVEQLARVVVDVDGPTPRRLAGAVTGRALVDGRMTVEEGVAACVRFG
jgi:phosphoribosylformimino-5-aminoimidazole carboxamide ribotide isomerase